MRKSIIGAAVAALALGGATVAFGQSSSKSIGDAGPAIAVGGGPDVGVAVAGGPHMVFGGGPDGTFAADLADELGVSTEEVEQALEAVAEKQRSEHQQQMAEALSEHVDGVSVEQIQAALAVAEEQMQQAIEDGEAPAPDQFTATLADELGFSEDEVEEALTAMREATFDAHRDEGLKRLDEAVEAGKLSEEEANAIRERLESGPPTLDADPGERSLTPIGPPPPDGPGVSFAFPAG